METLLARIQGTQLDSIEYQGQRVVTLAMIDELHQAPSGSALASFNRNRDEYIEGDDFIVNSGSNLFTEAGYLKIVFEFNDDLAWQVHRQMVNANLRAKELANARSAQQDNERLMDFVVDNPAALCAAPRRYRDLHDGSPGA